MPRRREILDIPGLRRGEGGEREGPRTPGPRRRFLSVWYRCCHAYGRLYRNTDETAYIGRCPRCGARVQALIGPGGTDQRCFEAK